MIKDYENGFVKVFQCITGTDALVGCWSLGAFNEKLYFLGFFRLKWNKVTIKWTWDQFVFIGQSCYGMGHSVYGLWRLKTLSIDKDFVQHPGQQIVTLSQIIVRTQANEQRASKKERR